MKSFAEELQQLIRKDVFKPFRKLHCQLQLLQEDFTYHEELSRVLITVVNAELTSIDADVATNGEVLRHEGLLGSVTLENHVSLKESALRNSTIGLLGLGDHDRLILKIVENCHLSNSVVFVWILDYWFLEVSTEGKHL